MHKDEEISSVVWKIDNFFTEKKQKYTNSAILNAFS